MKDQIRNLKRVVLNQELSVVFCSFIIVLAISVVVEVGMKLKDVK